MTGLVTGGDESGFVHVAFDMPDPEADAGTCEGMVNTLDPAFDAISEFTDSTSGRDDMHLLSDDDIEGDDDSSSSGASCCIHGHGLVLT